jgi:hypothetical protein
MSKINRRVKTCFQIAASNDDPEHERIKISETRVEGAVSWHAISYDVK